MLVNKITTPIQILKQYYLSSKQKDLIPLQPFKWLLNHLTLYTKPSNVHQIHQLKVKEALFNILGFPLSCSLFYAVGCFACKWSAEAPIPQFPSQSPLAPSIG